MVQSISSSTTSSASLHQNLFKKLDKDSSGTVDKTEFVAGRPDDVSEDQAGQLFDSIDSKKTGSLSETDLMSAFQQMGPPMQSTLLQAQEESGSDDDDDGHDPSALFAKLDTDGDGTISKDEFLAGKPKNVSDDQASAFFDKISNGNGDSLTQDQFVSGMENAGPPPPPPSGLAGSSDAGDQLDQLLGVNSSSTSSTSDPGQLLDQLLAALSSSSGSSTTSSSTGTDTTSTTGIASAQDLLQQFMKAVSAYQNTAFQTSAATLAQATSVAA
jgi:Ca2+-binding EF-hand superfamily protein